MTEENEQHILKTIERMDGFPTIPAVAVEVLRIARDPRVSVEKVAGAIAKDPALAAKTLRFANSSYYGASREIVSLSQALVRIGLRGATMLALSFSLVDAFQRNAPTEFDFPAFWYRSLTTSVTARRIAERSVRGAAEEAFVAALLADVGRPVLARAFPRQYRSVQQMFRNGHRDLEDIEQRVLGIAHPAVSRLVLETWRLPDELVRAVGDHARFEDSGGENEISKVAAVVRAAGRLADIIVRGATKQRVRRLASLFRKDLSFNPGHVHLLLHELGPEVQQAGHLLSVPLPPVDRIQTQAKVEMLRLAMAEKDPPPEPDADAPVAGPAGGAAPAEPPGEQMESQSAPA